MWPYLGTPVLGGLYSSLRRGGVLQSHVGGTHPRQGVPQYMGDGGYCSARQGMYHSPGVGVGTPVPGRGTLVPGRGYPSPRQACIPVLGGDIPGQGYLQPGQDWGTPPQQVQFSFPQEDCLVFHFVHMTLL